MIGSQNYTVTLEVVGGAPGAETALKGTFTLTPSTLTLSETTLIGSTTLNLAEDDIDTDGGENFFVRATLTYGTGSLAVTQAPVTVAGAYADDDCEEDPERFPLDECESTGVRMTCARNCGTTYRQCVHGQTFDTVCLLCTGVA